jgi:hypothetical protein
MEEKICLTGLLLGMNHGCITNNPSHASVQWKHPSSPSNRKYKVTPSSGKVMLGGVGDSQGVLLAHLQKRCENVNSASYCEVLLKLRDAITRKGPGQ